MLVFPCLYFSETLISCQIYNFYLRWRERELLGKKKKKRERQEQIAPKVLRKTKDLKKFQGNYVYHTDAGICRRIPVYKKVCSVADKGQQLSINLLGKFLVSNQGLGGDSNMSLLPPSN